MHKDDDDVDEHDDHDENDDECTAQCPYSSPSDDIRVMRKKLFARLKL